jgi:hypothetical protein
MKKVVSALIAVALSGGLVAGTPSLVNAYPTFTVQWTHIGIYPRTDPSMKSTNHAGPAVPDGTRVEVICEDIGQTVTSDVATTDIWEKTTIGWIPNAFVETGVNGWTPGVPRCTSSSQPAPVQPAPQQPAPQQPPSPTQPQPQVEQQTPQQPASPAEVPRDVLAENPGAFQIPNQNVSSLLYGHYLTGLGGVVIVDWSFFASSDRLREFAMSLPLTEETSFKAEADLDGDLYWAMGTFGVYRTSEHCFSIRDPYDFNPLSYGALARWESVKPFGKRAQVFVTRSAGCWF